MAAPKPPRMHVIQAAYGDCFLLEYDDEDDEPCFWLVDGGPGNQGFAGSHKTTNWCLFSTLNSLEIEKLDRLIVTHDDRDHTFGIHALLRGIRPYNEWNVGIRKKKQPGRPNQKQQTTWDRNIVKYAEWIGGKEALNAGRFPVENIWYNDKRVVMEEFAPNRAATKGWMSNIMNWFAGKNLGSEDTINADWDGYCVTVENCETLNLKFDKITKIVGPYDKQLEGNYGHFKAQLRNTLPQPGEVEKQMEEETEFKFDGLLSNLKSLATYNKNGVDRSVTNLSSIMFEFQHEGYSILMTGDGNGETLVKQYPNAAGYLFDIFKVMHHGSSNNNALPDDGTGLSTIQRSKNFFLHFQARKYVISSDFLNRTPNPDHDCLIALAKAISSSNVMINTETRLYLTNGMDPIGFQLFKYEYDEATGMADPNVPRQGYTGEIWVLGRGADIDYGTVIPTRGPNSQDPNWYQEAHWLHIRDDAQFYSYIKSDRAKYFKGYIGNNLTDFFNDIRKLVAFWRENGYSNAKAKKMAHKTKKAAAAKYGVGGTHANPSYTRIQETLRSYANRGKPIFPNVAFSHMAVTSPFTTAPTQQAGVPLTRRSHFRDGKMTWHDLMIMNLLEVRGINYEDIRPYSPPHPGFTNILTQIDGGTLNWVDLPKFIQLMEGEYRQYPAIFSSTGRTSSEVGELIATMKHWLLKNSGQSEDYEVADLILAGTFLSAFFSEDEVADFMISLPINMDGVESVSTDPFYTGTPSTVLNMTVQNIRFGIYVPNAAQYAAGAKIETAKLYFELSAPMPDFMRTNAEDFMTWSVPYSNSLWNPHHTLLKHRTPLEVRMDWPFARDALVFCHYEADLILTYKEETNLIAEGAMFYKKGRPATHDVQVRKGDDGLLRALDIMTLLSPTAAIAATVIEKLATGIDIKDTGIDLEKIINEDLVLYDVGILMYQHSSGIRAVSIEDVYGTVKIETILHLAKDILPLPEAFSFPKNLPDLHLQVAGITAPTGQKYSLAFTYDTTYGFTVAAQVTIGSAGEPSFKFYLFNTLGLPVSAWLQMLDADHLTEVFKFFEFLGPALDKLTVDYIQLEVGKHEASWGVSLLAFGVTIGEINIPEEDPIFTLQHLTTDLQYLYASDSTRLEVEASLVLAGVPATCTIVWDNDQQAINELLDTEREDYGDEKPEDPATETSEFSGYLDVNISFPSEGPSVGDILHAILDKILEGTGLSTIVEAIPEEFLMVLESNRFQSIRLRLQKSPETKNKWTISSLFISAKLNGLEDALGKLLPSLKFEAPILKVVLSDLGDKKKMAYQVSIGSTFSVGGSLCDLSANFVSFPKSMSSKSRVGKLMTVGLTARPSQRGLPVGKLLQNFVDDQIGIRERVPEKFQQAIDSVTIDAAGLSFAKVAAEAGGEESWKLASLNIGISLFNDSWTPFEPFTISGIRLFVLHDLGVMKRSQELQITAGDKGKSATTIQFDASLKIKETDFRVAFTYGTNPKSYSFSFQTTQTLKIVDLVFDILDMAIEIPEEVESYISSILVVNTENFFISYSEGKTEEKLPASIVFSNQGEISLFGVGVSNISVFCEKPHDSTSWSSYTVSFALPTPCSPFSSFLKDVPGLDDIKIKNGKFSYFKNEPSKKVFNQRQHAIASTSKPSKGSDVMLSGTIDLTGSSFLKLISSIIKIKEIDVCLQSTAVKIAIPAGDDNGIELFEKLITIKAFELCMAKKGFSFGAYAELRADWFCRDVVTSSLSIGVQFNGAIGGDVAFSRIDQPFDMPGVYLEDSRFSMVFLTEAATPQSVGVKAGVLLKDIPADNIKASLDMYIDALTPWNSYFKMDIENLTLANLVKAMTHGQLPSPLDGDILRVGFKKLKVEVVPKEQRFTLDAEFYLFALTGKVQAEVDIKTGISFAAHLSVINILDMVKIHSYKNDRVGPFTFLDTRYKSIVSGQSGPPAWLNASAKDDPNLKSCVFALSARLNFLGIKLGAYGVLNTKGLQLFLDSSAAVPVTGVNFSLNGNFSLIINQSSMTTVAGFKLKIGLNFEDIDLFGLSIGSYKGSLLEFTSNVSLTVNYGGSDWNSNGVSFSVWVEVKILSLKISGTCRLDISLKSLKDIPKAIASWVEREIVRKLKEKIIKPIEEGIRKVGEFVEGAGTTLKKEFNAATHEIVGALEECGHTIDDIVATARFGLNLSLDGCVSTLTNFGHDLSTISDAVGKGYGALPSEVLFGLHAAGLPTEHVLEKAFGPIGAAMPLGFNFLGSAVSSFAPLGLGSLDSVVSHTSVPIALEKLQDFAITLPGSILQDFIGGGLFKGPTGAGPAPSPLPSPGKLIGIFPGLVGRGLQHIAPPGSGVGFQPFPSIFESFNSIPGTFQAGFQTVPAPFGGFSNSSSSISQLMPVTAAFNSGTATASSAASFSIPATKSQITNTDSYDYSPEEAERERMYQKVESLRADASNPAITALPLPASFFNLLGMKTESSLKRDDVQFWQFTSTQDDRSITEARELEERASFLENQQRGLRLLLDGIVIQRKDFNRNCQIISESLQKTYDDAIRDFDRLFGSIPFRKVITGPYEKFLYDGLKKASSAIEDQFEVFERSLIKEDRFMHLDRNMLEELAEKEGKHIRNMELSFQQLAGQYKEAVRTQVSYLGQVAGKISR
ncbi:hypothetical protein TWF506_008242 [Arthrobotrys conoides]|uniref:Uncharacterized protein n=1 Tax=Arthrobotrys conoides TaxID=74498 RepID=A0AAN8N5L8_9PEZI